MRKITFKEPYIEWEDDIPLSYYERDVRFHPVPKQHPLSRFVKALALELGIRPPDVFVVERWNSEKPLYYAPFRDAIVMSASFLRDYSAGMIGFCLAHEVVEKARKRPDSAGESHKFEYHADAGAAALFGTKYGIAFFEKIQKSFTPAPGESHPLPSERIEALRSKTYAGPWSHIKCRPSLNPG